MAACWPGWSTVAPGTAARWAPSPSPPPQADRPGVYLEVAAFMGWLEETIGRQGGLHACGVSIGQDTIHIQGGARLHRERDHCCCLTTYISIPCMFQTKHAQIPGGLDITL